MHRPMTEHDYYDILIDTLECIFFHIDMCLIFWICDAVAKEVILIVFKQIIYLFRFVDAGSSYGANSLAGDCRPGRSIEFQCKNEDNIIYNCIVINLYANL